MRCGKRKMKEGSAAGDEGREVREGNKHGDLFSRQGMEINLNKFEFKLD
jgi:hypothetical protein